MKHAAITHTVHILYIYIYSYSICTVVTLSDHVSANSDSAEHIAEDSDAAVDEEEEEDDEEVLVEEDQIQTSVCATHSTIKPQLLTCTR